MIQMIPQRQPDTIRKLQESMIKMQEATCLLIKKVFNIKEEPAKDDKKEKVESVKFG